MINLQDVIEKIANKKDNLVKLPNENKYTQKNAYQITVSELENVLSDSEIKNSIKQYTNYETKISQVNNNVKSFNKQNNEENNSENNKSNKSNKLVYNDSDIIDIPNFLKLFFEQNKLECKNYYLYGIKNLDSFFTSLILLSEPDYIIKSRSEKLGYISSFKKELAINLSSNFKKFNYKKFRFGKDKMIDELINTNNVNYSLQVVTVDNIKVNTCILDIENKVYIYIETQSETDKYYIIVKLNNNYLPIMNVNNNHLFEQDHFNYIKENFNKYNFSTSIFKERKLDINETTLKAITSYKVADLQELANNHNISIKKDGNKNKTKKELYQELLTCM